MYFIQVYLCISNNSIFYNYLSIVYLIFLLKSLQPLLNWFICYQHSLTVCLLKMISYKIIPFIFMKVYYWSSFLPPFICLFQLKGYTLISILFVEVFIPNVFFIYRMLWQYVRLTGGYRTPPPPNLSTTFPTYETYAVVVVISENTIINMFLKSLHCSPNRQLLHDWFSYFIHLPTEHLQCFIYKITVYFF